MTCQTHPQEMTLIHLRKNNYRRKRRKDMKHWKEDPIRQCATLTKKLLPTALKSKIIKFKMDEDPLQRQIYFLTFIDSLDMIFLNIEKLVKSF